MVEEVTVLLQVGEWHEPDAPSEGLDHAMCRLQREAGLAAPRCTDECHQTRAARKQGFELQQFATPTKEAGKVVRQVTGLDGLRSERGEGAEPPRIIYLIEGFWCGGAREAIGPDLA